MNNLELLELLAHLHSRSNSKGPFTLDDIWYELPEPKRKITDVMIESALQPLVAKGSVVKSEKGYALSETALQFSRFTF